MASPDRGYSWSRILTSPSFVLRALGSTLFAGVYNDGAHGGANGVGLLTSTLPLAGSPVWTPVAAITTPVLAIDSVSTTVLLGTGIGYGVKGGSGARWDSELPTRTGQVYLSSDGGATWADVTPLVPAGSTHPPFRSVAINPTDVRHLTVAGEGVAYQSSDSGATWTTLSDNSSLWRAVYRVGTLAGCPDPVSDLSANIVGSDIVLTWTAPVTGYVGAIVRVATATVPALPTDGTLVTDTTGTGVTISGVPSGWSLAVFAKSLSGRVCDPATLASTLSATRAKGDSAGRPPIGLAGGRAASASVIDRTRNVLGNSLGIFRTNETGSGKPVVYVPVGLARFQASW